VRPEIVQVVKQIALASCLNWKMLPPHWSHFETEAENLLPSLGLGTQQRRVTRDRFPTGRLR
jgi:hypothetical protein